MLALGAIYLGREQQWNCSAKLIVAGHSEKKEQRWVGSIDSFRTEVTGTWLVGAKAQFLPTKFTIRLRGHGRYDFRYSDTVTEIRLWDGAKVLYEGPPIGSFATGADPIAVEFEWDKIASVEVADRCSINSIARSLLR